MNLENPVHQQQYDKPGSGKNQYGPEPVPEHLFHIGETGGPVDDPEIAVVQVGDAD